MSDIRTLLGKIGEDEELVEMNTPEWFKDFDESQEELMQMPSPDETARRLSEGAQSTKNPAQTQMDQITSLMLSAETQSTPEQIQGAIGAYQQALGGGNKEKLVSGVAKRFWGSVKMQVAVPYIIKHMFSQDPVDLAKAQALMEDMPADEVLWQELPQFTREEYMKRALDDLSGVTMGTEEERQNWQQLLGADRIKSQALRMFKVDNAIPVSQYGPVKDLLFATAQTLPQVAIGGLFSLVGALPGLLLKREKAARIGSEIAGRTWMSAVETAFNYYDLITETYKDPETGEEVRFDPTIAAITSAAFGIFNGQVEYVQWQTLAAPLGRFMQSPTYQKGFRAAIRRGMQDGSLKNLVWSIAKRQGKQFAGRYPPEILEEVIQGISSWLNRELAVEINNRVQGTEFEHKNWPDLLRQSLETAGQAAKGFLLLQAGSSLYAGAQEYRAGRKLVIAPRVAPGGAAAAVPATMDQVILSGQESNLDITFPEKERAAEAEAKTEEAPAEKVSETAPVAEVAAVVPEAAEAATKKMRRTIEGKEFEFEEPPAMERGILAIRLRDGRIVSDPGAGLWIDVANTQRVQYADVLELGRVVNGIYIPEDQFNEWVAQGADESQLPNTASERFKESLRKYDTSLSDFQVEASAAQVEARARSMNLSAEEYLHGTFQHEIATNQAPPEGSLEQFTGDEQVRFNENVTRVFGKWEGQERGQAGWILSEGTIINKSGVSKESHRLGAVMALGRPEMGNLQRMEDMGVKGGAIRYNDDFKAVQAFGRPTEAQLRALEELLAGAEEATLEISSAFGDLIASDRIKNPDYEDLKRFFGRSLPRRFFQGGPQEYDTRRMGQKAIKFFGITHNPLEAGYILPDGTMLDFTGRHQATDDYEKRPDGTWKLREGRPGGDYLAGQRSLDHRDLIGPDDNPNPLGLRKRFDGTLAMAEFMKRAGAARIDARAQIASIVGPPTDAQIRTIAQALNAGYREESRQKPEQLLTNAAYIDVMDEKANTWASWEVFKPTLEKLQRVFSNLQPGMHTVRQTGPVYHGTGAAFGQFNMEFVGTGQGAGSFGWGMYFTSVEAIAREYAEMMAQEPGFRATGINQRGEGFAYEQEELSVFVGMSLDRWQRRELGTDHLERLLNTEIGRAQTEYARLDQQLKDTVKIKAQLGREGERDVRIDGIEFERGVQWLHMTTAVNILSALRSNPQSLKWEKGKARHLYEATLHKGKKPTEYTWLGWYERLPDQDWDKIIAQAQQEGMEWLEAHRPPGEEKLKNWEKELRQNTEKARDWLISHRQELKAMNALRGDLPFAIQLEMSDLEIGIVAFDVVEELRRLRDQKPGAAGKRIAEMIVELGTYQWNMQNLSATIERGQRNQQNSEGQHIYRFLAENSRVWNLRKGERSMEEGKKEASQFLLRAGIDGVRYPAASLMTGNRSHELGTNYVVFDDRAITVDKHVLYQRQPNWKLRSREIIQDKVRGPMPGRQILKMLKNNGVKDDEMKWIGLEKYLETDEKIGPIELLQFIADNNVELREKTLPTPKAAEEGYPASEMPRYEERALPGGTNYREILLQWANVSRHALVQNGEIRGYLDRPLNEVEQAAVSTLGMTEAIVRVPGNDIELQHFPDVPNLLVHARVTDRVGPNGEKILFIEEIQSDWHQRGREYGYIGQVKEPEIILKTQPDGTWRATVNGAESGPWTGTEEEVRNRVREAYGRTGLAAVPPAPFAKTWHEVMMKRLLQQAVEQGYDAFAWTTGQQQAERYDLSKQVDSISFAKKTDGSVRLEVMQGDADVSDALGIPVSIPMEKVADYIGKDLARQIEQRETPINRNGDVIGEFSGEGLKVGGEGMKGFYDKILVDFMRGYGKKWGATVGDVQLRVGGKTVPQAGGGYVAYDTEGKEVGFYETLGAAREAVEQVPVIVHSLPLTSDMKDAIQQGQHLWMRGKGAVSFAEDGRALIHVCQYTDFSTVVHELGHIWRRQLHARDVAVIERFLGVKDHDWDEDAEEKFANLTEQFVRENVIPAPELRALYGHFRNWLADIYERFGQFHFTEEVKQVFEGLFLPPTEREARRLMRPFSEEEVSPLRVARVMEQMAMVGTRGLGLNLAEIRTIGRSTSYANMGKVKTAESQGGIAPMGEHLQKGGWGRGLAYITKQMQQNPVRWRAILSRVGILEAEKIGPLDREDMAEYEFTQQVAAAYSTQKDINAAAAQVAGMSVEEIKKLRKGQVFWYDEDYKGKEPEPQPNGTVRIGPNSFQYSKSQQIRMLRDALTTARREARMQSRFVQQEERQKYQKRWQEHRVREEVNRRIEALKNLKTSKRYKQLPLDIRAPIDAVLDGIDLRGMRPDYRKHLATMAEWFGREENKELVELSDRTKAEIDRLEQTNIRDMTPAQVEALYQFVMHYMHLASEAQYVQIQEKRAELDSAVAAATKEMRPLEEQAMTMITSRNTPLEDAKQKAKEYFDTFLGIGQEHYDLIVEKISGINSIADKVFNRAIKDGRDRALSYEQAVADRFQKAVEEIGIERFGHWLEEEIETEGSKLPFRLTRGERMALYMHSQNEDNWASFTEAGFGFRHRRGYRNKVIKAGKHFVVADLERVIDDLSAEERAVCDVVAEILSDQGREIAPLFLEVNGYEFPWIEAYYHKDTMPIGRGSAAEEESMKQLARHQVLRPGVPKGFLKERMGVTLPLYLNSIAYDLYQSVTRTSAYLGFEKPLRNASRLLNNRDFKTAMIERYDERVWQEVRKGLSDVAGEQYSMDDFDKGIMRLRRNLMMAYLGFNPFTPLKQPLQLANASVYVKPDYLWRGVVTASLHPKAIKELHKMYSPEFRERLEMGFTRDIAEFNRIKASRAFVRARQTWKQLSLWGIRFLDAQVVASVMKGAVDQVLDELEVGQVSDKVAEVLDLKGKDLSKFSADDRVKLAYQYADYAVERTQDIALPEHRSPLSRGGPIARLFTMFGSSTNANWNLLKRMVFEARQKKSGAAYGRLALALLSVLAIQPVFEAGIDTFRDLVRRRERKKKDFLWKVILSISGMWYFIRDVAGGVQSMVQRGWGGEIDLAPTRILNLVAQTIANGVKLISEESSTKRRKAARDFADDSIDLLMILSETPLYTTKRTIQDLMKEARVWPYRRK